MTTQATFPEYQHRAKLNGKTTNGDKIQVDANLHYLEGNSAPYFSVTGDGAGFGGCCHDKVLEAFPELAPVVALHLADMNGAPSHAVANGIYWVTENKPETLASHLRTSIKKANKLINSYITIRKFKNNGLEGRNNDGTLEADLYFQRMVDTMRPRWEEEAKKAIELLESIRPNKEPLSFYDQQTLDFLTDHKAVISKAFKRTEAQKHNPDLINDIYEVILCRDTESYTFDFHASHNDSGAVLIKYKGKKNDPFRNQEGVKVGSIEEAEKMLKEVHRTRSSLFNTLNEAEKRVYRMINAIPIQSVFAMKPKEWITEIKRTEPSDYSILSCLQKYEVGSFQNFIDDFGYELDGENYGETMKTYQAVLGEYNNLKRLFSDDELEVMQEIQ